MGEGTLRKIDTFVLDPEMIEDTVKIGNGIGSGREAKRKPFLSDVYCLFTIRTETLFC